VPKLKNRNQKSEGNNPKSKMISISTTPILHHSNELHRSLQ